MSIFLELQLQKAEHDLFFVEPLLDLRICLGGMMVGEPRRRNFKSKQPRLF